MLFVKGTTCSLDEIFHSRFQLLFRSTFSFSLKRETDEKHRRGFLLLPFSPCALHRDASVFDFERVGWKIEEDIVQGRIAYECACV